MVALAGCVRQARLVSGMACRARGNMDQRGARAAGAHRGSSSGTVQLLVEDQPVAVRRIQARALLEPHALGFFHAPPVFRRAIAELPRLFPFRDPRDLRAQREALEITRDLALLGLAQRLAERAEPGFAHSAGSEMPSGSTVLFARAM